MEVHRACHDLISKVKFFCLELTVVRSSKLLYDCTSDLEQAQELMLQPMSRVAEYRLSPGITLRAHTILLSLVLQSVHRPPLLCLFPYYF